MKQGSAIINDGSIELSFEYDIDTIQLVKDIDGRRWDAPKHPGVWSLPATAWHAEQVCRILPEFYIDPTIKFMAEGEKVKPKIRLPKELYEFQKQGVKYIASVNGRCIVADDMGLGKSAEALIFLRYFSAGKVLIVSPANVTFKWAEVECARWWPGKTVEVITTGKGDLPDVDILVMSYAIMVNRYEELKDIPFQSIILDEAHYCFVRDTRIETSAGKIPIQDIRVGDLVASCNSSSNVVEYKKVLTVMKNPAPDKLVEVAGMICTEDHPIFTEENQYVSSQSVRGYTLRKLREGDDSKQRYQEGEEVLLPKMQCNSSGEFAGSVGAIQITSTRNSERNQTPRRFKKDERKQSNVNAGSERKDGGISQGKNLLIERRKWKVNRSPTTPAFRLGYSIGIRIRSTYRRCKSFVSFLTSPLQGRYWNTRTKVGNRSGWGYSQVKEVEVPRPSQDGSFESVRVDSIEILERGSGQRFNEVCPDNTVYNIEVEGNNNYFANGILVHNCKAPKAQRTKVAKALIHAGIPHALLLSGTPFMNNPGELFSLLNILDPIGFSNFYSYAIRYTGAFKSSGIWVFPKDVVTNKEELEGRLKNYMIRRTKQEVELELPELTRTYVPVELGSKGEYKKAVEEFKDWKKQRKNYASALVQLTKLRQIIGREKVDATVELAENILDAGRKVVIFCHHREIVSLLEKSLRKYGVGIIAGETKAEDRQRQADIFLLDTPKMQCIIITVAGAEGLNLYSASDILFAEREYTPAREEQAEARLHRIGQKNNVNAYYVVLKGTIDERMNNLVKRKREVIGQVISQDDIVEEILESM